MEDPADYELTEADFELEAEAFDEEAADDGDNQDERLQSIVTAALTDAADYIDTEVAPAREKALAYYHGKPFGNEEEGRSQLISRDVHDTVKALLPSLLRTFFGTQRVVEFNPGSPDDVQSAEQATDYVNYVVTRDNPGFITLHSALKDALIQRTGIVKYWWDESEEVTEETYTGLDGMTAVLLEQDENAEIVEDSITQEEGPEGEPLYSFRVRYVHRDGRVRIAALPPEEFLIDRKARSKEDATLMAHRAERSLSDLMALGYPREVIERHLGDDTLESNPERVNREGDTLEHADDFGDESQRVALYTEAYIRVDHDGDGRAELRKVCCIGPNYEILHHEPAPEAPFADFCPDPEPHRFIGSSTADQVQDIQLFKSGTLRNMSDSLAQSIHPRTGVIEGQVNMDDVLNNETGAIIRMRREGAVQPFSTPFVGQQAFPVLEYMDQVKAARTGITEATQGLNGDSMQSSTRLAVQATVEAAQQQLELVARVMLETGLRNLYRGVLGVIRRHQDKARVVRLRGKQWVQVDPRSWNVDMDAEVSTALGTGTDESKLQRLDALRQMQKEVIDTYGPNNPLVSLGQYSHTLTKITELAGFRDPSAFVNELPADFQLPMPEPKPTPEEMLAQVQMKEIESNIQKKAAELQLEREKILRSDDRERDRIVSDIMLRASDIEGKHEIAVNVGEILSRVDAPRPGNEYS